MTTMTKAVRFNLLLLWHGLLAGGYTVAYLTAEGGGGSPLHRFAGYVVLALLAVRLVVATLVSEKDAWALPWPGAAQWQLFWRKLEAGDARLWQQRTPLVPLLGLVILATLVLVGVSGLAAEWWKWEDLHEGVAEGSLAIVVIHVMLVSLAPLLRNVSRSAHEQGAPQREA